MRILFFTYHFPTPDEPGPARPWGTAQLLKELGHEVIVVTSGSNYMTGEITQSRAGLWSVEDMQGLTVIKTFSLTNYRKSSLHRLANYLLHSFIIFLAGLKVRRPHVIISSIDVLTDPVFKLPLSYLLAKIKASRLVIDYRDPYPEIAVALGYLKSKLLITFMDKCLITLLKRAEHIIAASPGFEKILIKKGIPREQITVVPNAFYQLDSSYEKEEHVSYPLPSADVQKRFSVLCAGGLGQSKEILTILKAARLIRERCVNDMIFAFVGEGEKKKGYIEYCQENNIDICQFFPAAPKRVLPDLIQRCSVGVYSLPNEDIWQFPVSNTIFDYLANGRPVVFAGRGATAEIILDAKAGIVVEPEDPIGLSNALLELYHNANVREEMGRNGREYMLKYYPKEEFLGRFKKVLDNVGPL